MNIVILGGNGYLGEKLGKFLSERNINIYSVMRKYKPQTWACAVWEISELEERLAKCQIDCMINCIACYERGNVLARDIIMANYAQPYECFCQGISNNIRKYITMDTGLPADCNLYSRTKKQFADSIDWKLRQSYGEKGYLLWNIQLENFYGEDEPSNRFIPETINKLLKNEKILLTQGKQIRDFIYIKDVLLNLERLLYLEESGRIDLPLGSGTGVSIRDAILYLKEITKSQSELCFGVIPSRKIEPDCIADIEKMKSYNLKVMVEWKEGFNYIVTNRNRGKDM